MCGHRTPREDKINRSPVISAAWSKWRRNVHFLLVRILKNRLNENNLEELFFIQGLCPGAHTCQLNQHLKSEHDSDIKILWKEARWCSQVRGGINGTFQKVRTQGTSEIIICWENWTFSKTFFRMLLHQMLWKQNSMIQYIWGSSIFVSCVCPSLRLMCPVQISVSRPVTKKTVSLV